MTKWNFRLDDVLKERAFRHAERIGAVPSDWLRSVIRRELDRRDRKRNPQR